MKLLKSLLSVCLLFSNSVFADRGEDKDADALYDVQLGMAGLKQASKDPTLLAQMIQDMQVSGLSCDYDGNEENEEDSLKRELNNSHDDVVLDFLVPR